jgi:hypothetical protein
MLAESLGDRANRKQRRVLVLSLILSGLGSAIHARKSQGFMIEPKAADKNVRATRTLLLHSYCYCAAFTSFQISLYLARRGTFCQK